MTARLEHKIQKSPEAKSENSTDVLATSAPSLVSLAVDELADSIDSLDADTVFLLPAELVSLLSRVLTQRKKWDVVVLSKLMRSLPDLEDLSMGNWSELDADTLQTVAEKCSALTSIDLRCSFHLFDIAGLASLPSLSSLQTLNLDRCRRLPTSGCKLIHADHMPSLRHLN